MAQVDRARTGRKGAGKRQVDRPRGGASRGPRPARAGEPRRRERRDVDAPPVVGGRFYIALGLIAATSIVPFWTGLGAAMAPKDPRPTDTSGWRVGNTASMKITLITADINLLSCASDVVIEGRHCEYKDNKTLWPKLPGEPLDDNKRTIIQPYRTWPDNRLILISGLWAEPHVAMRLHREPPHGVLDKKLARFVTNCEMRFIGQIDSPKLRWGEAGDFNVEKGQVFVAHADSCKVVTTF